MNRKLRDYQKNLGNRITNALSKVIDEAESQGLSLADPDFKMVVGTSENGEVYTITIFERCMYNTEEIIAGGEDPNEARVSIVVNLAHPDGKRIIVDKNPCWEHSSKEEWGVNEESVKTFIRVMSKYVGSFFFNDDPIDYDYDYYENNPDYPILGGCW